MGKWNNVIFILVTVISIGSSQDINKWCPNIRSDLMKCSDEFLSSVKSAKSLFTDASKLFDIKSVMSQFTSVICEEATLTVVKRFYRCIYGKMFACIPGEWRKAFPDVDKSIASIEYLCQNIDDIDIGCVASLSKMIALRDCMQKSSSGTAPDVTTVDGYLEFICGAYPKIITCSNTAFGTCPKKTAEVMIKSFEYQKPIGCNACMFKPYLTLLVALLSLSLLKERIEI